MDAFSYSSNISKQISDDDEDFVDSKDGKSGKRRIFKGRMQDSGLELCFDASFQSIAVWLLY